MFRRNIFTQPLGLDKMLRFSGAIGLRHLHVPNLRGTKDHEREQERSGSDREAEPDEFFFGLAKEAEGDRLRKPKADPLKRLKAFMGAATEGKSRIQPLKGEMKPRREKRPKRKHGQMW